MRRAGGLYVNARTERDWERWSEYITARPEVTHIAFEFATGAGWAGRIGWHISQLAKLAQDVNRPLHLIVRGGGRELPVLATAFSEMTWLDTATMTVANRWTICWQRIGPPPNFLMTS